MSLLNDGLLESDEEEGFSVTTEKKVLANACIQFLVIDIE